jgi:hypothetical protein
LNLSESDDEPSKCTETLMWFLSIVYNWRHKSRRQFIIAVLMTFQTVYHSCFNAISCCWNWNTCHLNIAYHSCVIVVSLLHLTLRKRFVVKNVCRKCIRNLPKYYNKSLKRK